MFSRLWTSWTQGSSPSWKQHVVPKRPYAAAKLQTVTSQTPVFTVKRSERLLYKRYNLNIHYMTKNRLPFNCFKESNMFCLKI